MLSIHGSLLASAILFVVVLPISSKVWTSMDGPCSLYDNSTNGDESNLLDYDKISMEGVFLLTLLPTIAEYRPDYLPDHPADIKSISDKDRQNWYCVENRYANGSWPPCNLSAYPIAEFLKNDTMLFFTSPRLVDRYVIVGVEQLKADKYTNALLNIRIHMQDDMSRAWEVAQLQEEYIRNDHCTVNSIKALFKGFNCQETKIMIFSYAVALWVFSVVTVLTNRQRKRNSKWSETSIECECDETETVV